VREIRRLGQFGLTESELQRYKQASLGEAMQGAAQAGQKGHDDVMSTWICSCSVGDYCCVCSCCDALSSGIG
jgi:hypothetical protein